MHAKLKRFITLWSCAVIRNRTLKSAQGETQHHKAIKKQTRNMHAVKKMFKGRNKNACEKDKLEVGNLRLASDAWNEAY